MMLRDTDPARLRWVAALIDGFIKAARKGGVGSRDLDEWNPLTVVLLQDLLYTTGRIVGDNGGHYWLIREGADRMNLPRKTLTRYLKALARAGIIKCVVAYERGHKRRLPTEILLQEDIARDSGKTRIVDATRLGGVFADIWLSRYEIIGDVQGFDGTCKFGFLEEGRRTPETVQFADRKTEVEKTDLKAKIAEAVAPARKTIAGKSADDKVATRVAVESFIHGAATVWVEMQRRSGRNVEAPAWAGPRHAIPAAQRAERSELEKIFLSYGGRKASLAWTAFCGWDPELDDDNKRVFNPDIGWRQWTTPDKPPRAFAKHINAIFADGAKHGVWTRESFLVNIRKVFADVWEFAPRIELTPDRFTTTHKQTVGAKTNATETTIPPTSTGRNPELLSPAERHGIARGGEERSSPTPETMPVMQ